MNPLHDQGTDPQISVVIPAFNEELRIGPTIQDLARTLDSSRYSWEVVVANDGSTDGTASVVNQLIAKIPQLRLHSHVANRGKGAAVRTGVLAASGTYILFTDADGAAPFSQIDLFVDAIDGGADMAVGNRWAKENNNQRSITRSLPGRTFAILAKSVVGVTAEDPQCGFKMFSSRVAKELFRVAKEDGYLFDLELLGLAHAAGLKVMNVPICWQEKPGSKVNVLRDSPKMALGLIRIRRSIRAVGPLDLRQSDSDSTAPKRPHPVAVRSRADNTISS